VAIAGDTLFVADANRASFTPINNRVLLYRNLSNSIPKPGDEFARYSGRCPACVGTADVVLGQPDFTKTDIALTQTGLRLPTAIASDGRVLAVADTANNRVLLWRSVPATNDQPADIVLGKRTSPLFGRLRWITRASARRRACGFKTASCSWRIRKIIAC